MAPTQPDTEPDSGFKSARVIIEVVAGIIPKTPEPEFTRRYAITSDDWHNSTDQAALMGECIGKAQGYAATLMMRPDRLNWVETTWLWL
jgi:hypothetical protein